jgi:UDP-glucose 4-epimerase
MITPQDKHILFTDGTGSLRQAVVRRLLTGETGRPSKIVVFSRDEAKQYYMCLLYLNRLAATDEVIYSNFQGLLSLRIGDVRDYSAILQAVGEADVIIHAAALKQVPTCEYSSANVTMDHAGLIELLAAYPADQSLAGISA